MTEAHSSSTTSRHQAWPWVLVFVAVIIFLPWVRLVLQDGNLTRPVRFGSDFDERQTPALQGLNHVVVKGPGFDGQFYQQIALDPLLLKPETAAAMDDVRIRARRCLTPWTAWLLGLGQPSWILWTYPLLSLGAWLALGFVFWRLLPPSGSGAAAFAVLMLGPGVIEAASRALPDLPAFTLGAASLLAAPASALGLIALAALGRETMLLSYLGQALPAWKPNALLKWSVKGVLALLPLALWLCFLQWRFSSGERVDGTNLSWPLAGLLQRIQFLPTEWAGPFPLTLEALVNHRGIQSLVLVVSYLTQLLFIARYPDTKSGAWRWAAVTALFSLFIAWPTWEAFYTVTRHLLPLHLGFNLLLSLKRPRAFLFWFLLGNLFVLPRLLFWLDFP